jgi:hypothetical protein
MGPPSIPSKLFVISPIDSGEGSSGGGGQSAGGNNGSSTKIPHAQAIFTPSVELDDAKLDDMFGKPNKDHLSIAKNKVVGQLEEMRASKAQHRPSIYGLEYPSHLRLDVQDCNAIARQLLGLRKSYAMHYYDSIKMSKVFVPSANGNKHKSVGCSQTTINDLNTTSTED